MRLTNDITVVVRDCAWFLYEIISVLAAKALCYGTSCKIK